MRAIRLLPLLLGLPWTAPALADHLYSDGFEPPHIEPLFPMVGGEYQLPSGPAADQLAWMLSELQAGENTSATEAQAHFDPANDPGVMAGFMNDLRGYFPDAKVSDVVGVSPLEVVVVIDSPVDDPTEPQGYLFFNAAYTGNNLVRNFAVTDYYGSVQYPADQNLSLTQAADKFETLSQQPALLVGRIRPGMQCDVVLGRQQALPRSTASQFKLWVLGGVARAIAEGTISIDSTTITLVASELAPAGLMNHEPLGTVFPLQDVTTLMMANSDNTATDLLHELVGRDWIEQIVTEFENTHANLLTPFLGISEQFLLLSDVTLSQAQSFVSGTETFQQQFLETEIEPLGSYVDDPHPYFHQSLVLDGTWRASPVDICKAFAHLLRLPQGSDAIMATDQALGAQAAQPEVRGQWDRVWYKGGSLPSGSGFYVLTHAWVLQNEGEDPWVVIAMSNSLNGAIDVYQVQSITGRILELVAQMTP